MIGAHTAHVLHFVAWGLALLDVVIVGLCLFLSRA
jgi:hypothetical protein